MKVYYLHIGRQRLGPFSAEELKNKSLAKDTPVWIEHANNWTTFGEIVTTSPARAINPNNRNSGKMNLWAAGVFLIILFCVLYFILKGSL